MAALVLLALLPLCAGTPAGLGSLGNFGFGRGAGYGMVPSRAMMDMAAQMMGMASQVARNAPRQALDAAGLRGHQDGWMSLSGAHRPGALMDMLPPPHQGVAQLGQLMGGKFVGDHSPHGLPHMGEKLVGEQPPMDGTFGMGGAPPPGGSSQLHIMEKLHGPSKDSGVTTPGQTVIPIGVAADYTYFAGKLAGGSTHNGTDPLDQQAAPISDISHTQPNAHAPGSQPAKDLHYHDTVAGQGPSSPGPGAVTYNGDVSAKASANGQSPGQKLAQNPQREKDQNLHPPPPPLTRNPIGPPSAEQLLMSNLFTMGLDKAGDQKQVIPEPVVTASKSRGLGPIPGLTAPLHDSPKAASNTADRALRAPCDLLVDAVFALDDMKNLWLAQESIRYYETQLLPSKKTRFGVVLCGQEKSFYTALHQHFSALLASLEDLQHANATLDPAQHMPDTPGHRSDNNPYPPRVSEDFAQIDAGCLETAYHLLTYQSPPNADRLLTVVGTKERWASKVVVEEARFLHSLNISLLTTADGKLSPAAHDSLRKMASSPDKFRSVSDNVTLRALPGMIGSAICRPQKADVTMTVQRTATGIIQEPVVKDCQQVDPVSMRRTTDFGPFFGIHTDHVRCPPGLVPDLSLCACV